MCSRAKDKQMECISTCNEDAEDYRVLKGEGQGPLIPILVEHGRYSKSSTCGSRRPPILIAFCRVRVHMSLLGSQFREVLQWHQSHRIGDRKGPLVDLFPLDFGWCLYTEHSVKNECWGV